MLELLGAIFSSALGGGATGLLGILIQRWMDHKKQQQDIELVKLQMEAADKTLRTELEFKERMAQRAAEGEALQARIAADQAEALAAEATVQASYKHDGATYSTPSAQQQSRVVRWIMGVVDGVRGLMRPGITAYTLWMLTALFLWVRALYGQMGLSLSQDQAMKLTMDVVGTITYLAVTTVVWWFGVRPSQPPGRR